MNRVMKYRAWDKDHKAMFMVNAIDFKKGEFLELENADKKSTSVIPPRRFNKHFALMQFTGLKDKNGKEIYEGDVVKIEPFNGIYNYSGNVLVEWLFEGWGFKWHPSLNTLNSFVYNGVIDKAEVIGNIYENSKLLKGEK